MNNRLSGRVNLLICILLLFAVILFLLFDAKITSSLGLILAILPIILYYWLSVRFNIRSYFNIISLIVLIYFFFFIVRGFQLVIIENIQLLINVPIEPSLEIVLVGVGLSMTGLIIGYFFSIKNTPVSGVKIRHTILSRPSKICSLFLL